MVHFVGRFFFFFLVPLNLSSFYFPPCFWSVIVVVVVVVCRFIRVGMRNVMSRQFISLWKDDCMIPIQMLGPLSTHNMIFQPHKEKKRKEVGRIT
ncbi:hypothetical protein ASPSYDRAFT_245858 [Aspergillus sydowii CBS 593.65]|uniref:Uncharacterized protein n=1 Tax=Aspergillus sydowii CBS 593.65 TaxID=1036612 RepID=A0A1L9TWC3_9EURO|nr:uncharacterized protein ASPSYDRAFT_245858 [Aspergillus sydowii CBS 593.65]OJJ63593.1 hypothetical protein ASPSYDRAFT_245858 [Aspergillus sydowii CBS 593.65]